MRAKFLTVFFMLFIMSCSGTRSNSKALLTEADIPETNWKSIAQIDSVKKLQYRIDSIVIEYAIGSFKNVDTTFKNVIAFGKSLENWKSKPADSLTIYSDLYWKAFVTMAVQDPLVDLVNYALLSKEYSFARASHILMFTQYRRAEEGLLYRDEFEYMRNFNDEINGEANLRIEKGIQLFDATNFLAAKKYYDIALQIHPKSDWAIYEIGQIELFQNMNKFADRLEKGEDQPEFVKARTWNPFQKFAWQGKKESAKNLGVILEKVEPNIGLISKGLQDLQPLKDFAQGTAEIGYYDLSAYAYYMLILLDHKTTNAQKLQYGLQMVEQIKKLGCLDAAAMIQDQFDKLFGKNDIE